MLTNPQKLTIKAWLVANAQTMNDQEAATALNASVSPDYFVLKGELGLHDFTDQSYVGDNGVAITTFVWGGSAGGFINRSPGELAAFRMLFNAVEKCYPKLANVRTAMDDIFSGSGAGAQANRAHFRAASRRLATVAEQLLAVATVGGPAQSGNRGSRTNPDTLTFDGLLTADDVVDAYNAQS